MARAICGVALALALLAMPALAEEELPPSSGELALEGVGKLMKALEIFIQSIPQFGAPYVDDGGNIIIPRMDPPIPDDSAVEETGTTT
jgi:hypothetical protein